MAYKPKILTSTEGGTGSSNTATSRKILVGDGTNFVSSTETWAVPGTSGNILTSDGTNWTSATASGGSTTLSGSLTNAQIKALHGTPVQIIAAPGSGKVIQIISLCGKMVYGGTNAFTAGAIQTIALYWGTAKQAGVILDNGLITATATQFQAGFLSQTSNTGTYTSFENAAINLYNPIATEITGNAANNNTVDWNITYRTVTI